MDPSLSSTPGDEQLALAEYMCRLHVELKQRFVELANVPQQRRGVSQRQVLLRLGQMWTIEAQLLLPALADDAALQQDLQHAMQEVEVLRDAALLIERCGLDLRALAWGITQGLAELHFAHIDGLLRCAAVSREGWRGLRDKIEASLAEREAQTPAAGDFEDEDQDPVGLPPR
jgi:hypothetical protein